MRILLIFVFVLAITGTLAGRYLAGIGLLLVGLSYVVKGAHKKNFNALPEPGRKKKMLANLLSIAGIILIALNLLMIVLKF
jgi:hypothetical protein